MLESRSDAPEPVLSRPVRIVAVTVGIGTLMAGGVAVFQTDNELGSTALVAAGVVMACLAVFANRIEAVEAAGVRLELERRARRAWRQAEQARAAGEIDRAEELERSAESLLDAASSLGSRYERLRTSEPSGWDRTSRMEEMLREARDFNTAAFAASDVADIFATGSDGNRIVALALIEDDPRLATVDILADAIVNSRSSFEQFHALVAAEHALDRLEPQERTRLRAIVESVLAGRMGDKSSDRRTVARRVLKRLTAG